MPAQKRNKKNWNATLRRLQRKALRDNVEDSVGDNVVAIPVENLAHVQQAAIINNAENVENEHVEVDDVDFDSCGS